MKRILLLSALFATIGLSAQTTHHIDNWAMGISNQDASLTIDQGDTVEWTWSDTLPHTVSSTAGSTETFDSGTISGVGETYSYTFTEIGANTYQCNVHPGMNGTITVEEVLGVNDVSKVTFEYYPNPTTDILTINAADVIDNITVYDMSGKLVMTADNAGNSNSKIYMQNYNAGTYFVKVTVSGQTKTISVVKQ
ncbi:T9SS type A sorting domain-containing protein [Flavobacterium rakeshii]|uniref:T9SS type A sorting domain-containing protein n=1 Tax=Flavobacterium rakeshii TaxID=1038845 RepID=UPI0018D26583|nr:T9SS type A sorting domain-containing protein [Flavobacterium rakeshii]MEE1897180.1 T9SS type A sorting domain-containing protein [Flavobacterium rakeshii]